jgi:hypothetical protein
LNTLNYSDDLAGVEDVEQADTAFQKMGQLLSELGLKEGGPVMAWLAGHYSLPPLHMSC